MLREIKREGSSGMTMIAVLLIALVVTGFFFYSQAVVENGLGIATALAAFAVEMVFMAGFFMVKPNEARVLQLFGEYVGTVRTQGLRWANPFYSKRRISVRVRNFETAKLKVNDQNSNPIEIGAVVVWKVVDTAEAMFEVDDYEDFVHESNQLDTVDGYVVANLRAIYQVNDNVSLFARVTNLFDTEYENFGLLGEDPGELLDFISDNSPVFLGAGSPRGAWVGARLRF